MCRVELSLASQATCRVFRVSIREMCLVFKVSSISMKVSSNHRPHSDESLIVEPTGAEERKKMAPQYHSINPVPASSITSADALARLKYLLASSIIAATLLGVAFSSTSPLAPLLSTRNIVTPHTGDFCANAEDYTKVRHQRDSTTLGSSFRISLGC